MWFKKNKGLSEEDKEIVITLNDLNMEIKSLHMCLDSITDPSLIDAHIYEMKALNMRYKYYLEMCKARGIMADVF
ncbi:MAG: YaaL family protein [Defluviitaleaceae bacterium]|nr:YaaL family protein [Defluviitaleaceae bacterium]